MKDNELGRLPLHHACLTRYGRAGSDPTASVRLLLEAFSEAALVQDHEGSLPIHVACKLVYRRGIAERLAIVNILLDATPVSTLTTSDAKGSLPLHYALGWISEELITKMVKLAPSGVSSANLQGNTPLHIVAMSSDNQLLVIQPVVRKICHDTLLAKNKAGRIPLQEFLESQIFVFDFKDRFADMLTLLLPEGWSPFHLVCQQPYSLRVIEKAAARFPNGTFLSVSHPKGGGYPLHFALRRSTRPPLEVVQFLVKNAPPNILTAGSPGSGDLPLHIACRNPVITFDIVQYLCDACPAAVTKKNKDKQLPLELVLERSDDPSLDSVYYLLLQAPSQLVRG